MSYKVYCVNAMEWIAPSSSQAIVSKCGSNKCLCCSSLNCDIIFKSNSTGRKFIFNKRGSFNCKTKNVIYLITCKTCNLQYVGQTTQALHCRLNGHRNSILHQNRNTFLTKHFRGDDHSIHDISIQIIDAVDSGNDKSKIVDELNKKEDFFIRTLNTLSPLGLNDKLQGGFCVSKGNVNKDCYFNSPIPRRKRSHGNRKRKSKTLHQNDSVLLTEDLRSLFIKKQFHSFYKKLKTIKISFLRELHNEISTETSDFSYILTAYIQNTVMTLNAKQGDAERVYINFKFTNKVMDEVNLHNIFHDTKICRLLPKEVASFYPPKIYISLNNPLSLKFCNYSKFLKDLELSDIEKILSSDCKCADHSDFIYQHYEHVMTGNTDFVSNPNLKNLFSLGTKHRVSKPMKMHYLYKEIENSLDRHVNRVSRRYKVPLSDFQEWRTKVMTVVEDRLRFIKSTYDNNRNNKKRFPESLTKEEESYLQYLHTNFIVTSVDKAASNYAFVCKKFYVMTLLKELGYDLSSFSPIGNLTYTPIESNAACVIKNHSDILRDEFDTVCNDKNLKLPKLFWIPKLHKVPYKFRFIAGAKHCSTKQLSILVNKGLSVIRDHFKRYCSSVYNNSGINCFWSVLSTSEFLNKVQSLDVKSAQVFDFSTLYTNLDQREVKEHIFKLLDLIFDNHNRKYLCVGYDKSFMSRSRYNGYTTFTKDKFKSAIKFILENVFITFGGQVFQQTRGIPMGGNCSPLLADLFLLHCEFVYMQNLLKNKKMGLAKLLSNTSRYIDDICIINYKHFNQIIKHIYPSSLEASRSGSNNKEVEYLDVKLSITNDGLRTSVYHKVDDFNFAVTLLTFPENTIPYKMGSQVFNGQLIRYGRICSSLDDFVKKASSTFRLLVARGYNQDSLINNAERCLHRHKELLLKFGLYSARQFSKFSFLLTE